MMNTRVTSKTVRLVLMLAFGLGTVWMPHANAKAQAGPTLVSATFFGGSGDQIGNRIVVEGTNIYLAGRHWPSTSDKQALVVNYSLPPDPLPLWSAHWPNASGSPDETFFDVAATAEGIYLAGWSYSQTFDGVGSKEVKGIVVKFNQDGPTGTDVGGADWVASPIFFPYRGYEFMTAVQPMVQAGTTFIYTVGHGGPCGGHASFVLGKYTTGGDLVNRVTEPGIDLNGYSCMGEGFVYGLTAYNGNMYVVGDSRFVGLGEDNVKRPVLMKYDPDLNRVWKERPADTAGSFWGATELGGALYVAGLKLTPGVPNSEDYLVQKYSENGDLLWSKTSGGSLTDFLTDIVSFGNRLFAVGYTRSQGAGGADIVILEIDPVTGDTLSTTLYGGAQDDMANGAAMDGADLYIVGESRSFASDAGNMAGQSDIILLRYSIAPSDTTSPTTTDNAPAEWQKSDFVVSLTCTDNPGGTDCKETRYKLDGSAWQAGDSVSITTEGDHLIEYYSVDNADNQETTKSAHVKLDKTLPVISWVSDVHDGDSFYFGVVPPEPTCAAFDNLSGIDGSCVVTAYSSAVGSHTLSAKARDMAGNQAMETRSYVVVPWSLHGFYQPVDMNGIYNLVKGGSTVPLKFEIFAGSTELINTAYISSLTPAQISCDTNAMTDVVETTVMGSTNLRYDSAEGQFIYNWKTPDIAGNCYRVTMTTIDGSSLVAYFKLK